MYINTFMCIYIHINMNMSKNHETSNFTMVSFVNG